MELGLSPLKLFRLFKDLFLLNYLAWWSGVANRWIQVFGDLTEPSFRMEDRHHKLFHIGNNFLSFNMAKVLQDYELRLFVRRAIATYQLHHIKAWIPGVAKWFIFYLVVTERYCCYANILLNNWMGCQWKIVIMIIING